MKSININKVIIIAVITAVLASLLFVACKDAKQMAKENRCPYEGYECPNAQAAIAEYTETIDSLKTVIAGYETKDHSKLANH